MTLGNGWTGGGLLVKSILALARKALGEVLAPVWWPTRIHRERKFIDERSRSPSLVLCES